MGNIARAFINHNDVLKVEIKSNDRVDYKDAAPLNDKKAIKRIFTNLERKGYINLKEILKQEIDDDWF